MPHCPSKSCLARPRTQWMVGGAGVGGFGGKVARFANSRPFIHIFFWAMLFGAVDPPSADFSDTMILVASNYPLLPIGNHRFFGLNWVRGDFRGPSPPRTARPALRVQRSQGGRRKGRWCRRICPRYPPNQGNMGRFVISPSCVFACAHFFF